MTREEVIDRLNTIAEDGTEYGMASFNKLITEYDTLTARIEKLGAELDAAETEIKILHDRRKDWPCQKEITIATGNIKRWLISNKHDLEPSYDADDNEIQSKNGECLACGVTVCDN